MGKLGHESSTLIFFLIGMGYSIPIMTSRRFPMLSSAAILAAATARFLLDYSTPELVDFVALIGLYIATVYCPVWFHRTTLGLTIAVTFLSAISPFIHGDRIHFTAQAIRAFLGIVILYICLLVMTYWMGISRRMQLRQLADLRYMAMVTEKRVESQSDLAVLEERSRIAREMHDIVAHTLSVVIAQADGGRYAATTNPEAAARALTTISDMARDALKDIRSIIGVLRNTDSSDQPTLPQPVDKDIEELVESVRESGVSISLIRTGINRSLPVGVGNAVYRICQEAITNSLKHAGPHPEINVMLQITDAHLVLQIDDDGRGAAVIPDGRGHGLIGMAERAAVFGGTVTTGPRPGGGFLVSATIPIPSTDNARTIHE